MLRHRLEWLFSMTLPPGRAPAAARGARAAPAALEPGDGMARHVSGCRESQGTRVAECVSMTSRAMVIGCRVSEDTRIYI
jgi:hypothetical protein